ncbi:MAG: FkbM family methyltransferase [Candidatus Bathyarchaeia archaeon]
MIERLGLNNTIKYLYHQKIDRNWNFIAKSKFGFKFKPFTNDGFLFYSGFMEPKTTKWLKDNIAFYDVFINVGAGYGEYTMLALAKGVDTIAFEPHPILYNYLRDNIALNRFQNCHLFQTAIGKSERKSKFALVDGMTSSHLGGYGRSTRAISAEIEVEVMPLTNFSHLFSRYVKPLFLIDVERAELEVIRGIPMETLEKSDLIIETDINNTSLFKFLHRKKCIILEKFSDGFVNYLFLTV